MLGSDPSHYCSPLSTRYATEAMGAIFSPQHKYFIWRKLWLSLARAQKELGVKRITESMLAELEAACNQIDFERVHFFEKETKHEVMAHLKAFAELCPSAGPILHLGATSAFVMDNGDLVQMREALQILKSKLLANLSILSSLALEYADAPCLSYTHLQPAQPTTIGKRIALWLQDLLWDFNEFEAFEKTLPFLGAKGTTGTQASFMALFSNNAEKVKQLEEKIAADFSFNEVLPISGQTYTRKIDLTLFNVLSSMAATLHKIGTDLRLLSHMGEITESFGTKQVGSSAMPYKRNPIRSERLCSLARNLISLWENAAYTASLQWLERSLDDSAGRRIYLPEAFLTADALLNLLANIFSHLTINKKFAQEKLDEHLPHLISEVLILKAVERGKDRSEVHEALKKHALSSTIEKFILEIAADAKIGFTIGELRSIMQEGEFTGRAGEQVREFIERHVHPLTKNEPAAIQAISLIEI